jgi:hypothetical protein
MEKIMVFDEKAKRKIGVICSIPLVSFLIVFISYSIILWPLTRPHRLYAVEEMISRNYDALFTVLAAAAIITAPVFIYSLVILAKLKNLNAAHKVMWIVALSISAPISSFLFWYFLIKNQPEQVPIYPDYA